MRVLIITFGTEGDVRPMAALGAALVGAGHVVQFMVTEDSAAAAWALAIPTIVLPGGIRAALGGAGTTGGAPSAAALVRVVNDNTSAWLRLALEHGADCDVVLAGGLAGFVGFSAAEKLGVLGVGAAMFPITPTAAFASPFFPPGAPAWTNRLSHRAANNLVWRSFARATNAARKEVGLSTDRHAWTDNPALYGFSAHIVPRPDDWPSNAAICGPWSKPTTDWEAPDDLNAFLTAGAPPIYVGFGSMALANPRRLVAALAEAIGDRRAIFYPGWSGISRADLPPNFHLVGPTPHDWLFTRTAMVIHHGGSGTTHAAARAGVPSIIVPFGGDQPFWADRVRRLGVAPAAINLRNPEADKIATAIAFADSDGVRARAAELGMAIASEDGLATAVALLQAWSAVR